MTDPLRASRVRYYVLAAVCAVTFINYVQRNSIGGVETTLREDLHVSAAVTANAMSFFFISYALMQIPSGWLAQRWGPRLALTLYTIGWSAALAALSLARSEATLYGGRLAMGVFQAGIFPCATLIMVAWLPPGRRAFASGLLNSFMLIGGAVVQNLTAALLAPRGPFGWRLLFLIYAVPGFLWALGFFLWFRNRPEDHAAVNRAELDAIAEGRSAADAAAKKPSASWVLVLVSISLWLICTQQFCRAGANRFVDQWLSTYLQENPLKGVADAGLRKRVANNLASAPQYAGVVGGLIGGLISDQVLRRTGKRRLGRNGVAIASLAVGVLLYLPVFAFEGAVGQVIFLSLGYFTASFAAPCAYAISMDVGGRNLPVVFGAMNMVGNFGAAAMAWVVPRANEWAGGDWRASIALFVGVHAIALVCWFFINPDRTIGEKSQ